MSKYSPQLIRFLFILFTDARPRSIEIEELNNIGNPIYIAQQLGWLDDDNNISKEGHMRNRWFAVAIDLILFWCKREWKSLSEGVMFMLALECH